MGKRLQDKVALVTGAGSIGPGWGNGKATAVLFAREGAKVFGIDLDLHAADETRGIIEAEGGVCATHAADVSKGRERRGDGRGLHGRVRPHRRPGQQRRHRAHRRHRRDRGGRLGPGHRRQPEERVSDLQARCADHGAAGQRRHRQHRVGGGAPLDRISYASYYATKGAVVSLSRAIALEFAAKGIRCNSVSPGLMDTPMVRYGLTGAYGKDGDVDNLLRVRTSQCPMGFMGTGWDTAHAVLFLACDEARYITGIDLIVDGGLTAKFA